VERLDGWDQVRFGADTEFNYRVEADGKIEVIPRILKEVPLAFALDLPSSLTRQDVTHVLTRFYGVRRNYHDAAWAWRNTLGEAANWRLTSHPGQRAFPAPRTMLPECPEPTEFDLMVIMDWALGGGAYVSTLNYVKAAVQSGLQVCVFHLRRYDLNVTARPHLEILKMAQEGQIYRVSPGEEVRAKTVLVGYPVILKYRFDLPPQIDCDRFCIIVNQMPNRLYSGGDPQYDPTIVTQNVKSLFGKEPMWIPISEMVRNLMKEDGRFEQVHFQTWNPLIDIKKGEAHRAVFRGHSRKKPVVGRHARDHYTKWPSSAEAIRDAYCVNQNCEVRILGGAKRALEILKQRPKNWVVEPFDNEGSGGFLEDLDFWIHYPHEDYIEEFGRAVIEAMVAGVPVILPPVFQPTFGDAAIYAEPQKVFSVVNSLFQDEAAWLGRASAGRAFVEHHNDLSRFTDRMNSLAPPPQEFTA
jgi:glycosyltransferase involved in cell wall biosynthesis